jgi:hypothetical protein
MENLEGFKVCSKCGAEKPSSYFYSRKTSKDGLSSWCRQCTQDDHKEWKKRNRGKVRKQKREWRRRSDPTKRFDSFFRYGVTKEWYDTKLAEQGGGCVLCGIKESGKNRFHIDHDHRTGCNRGILCALCNHTIERLESVEDWAAKAQQYLDRYEQEYWKLMESKYV